MTKKFAVCRYHDTYEVLNQEEYGTAWCRFEIIFETDNLKEAWEKLKIINLQRKHHAQTTKK